MSKIFIVCFPERKVAHERLKEILECWTRVVENPFAHAEERQETLQSMDSGLCMFTAGYCLNQNWEYQMDESPVFLLSEILTENFGDAACPFNVGSLNPRKETAWRDFMDECKRAECQLNPMRREFVADFIAGHYSVHP